MQDQKGKDDMLKIFYLKNQIEYMVLFEKSR